MDKKDQFKLASIFFAADIHAAIQDKAFVLNVDKEKAEKILLRLLDQNVLEEKFVTGIERKVDRQYEERSEEYSRTWNPDALTPSDGHGDWEIEYRTWNELVGEKHSIIYRQYDSERPIDVRYDTASGKLIIAAWAINTKPFEKALNSQSSAEVSRKILLSLADKSSIKSLQAEFNALSAVEAPTLEDALDQKVVDGFRDNVTSITRRLQKTIEKSGITETLKPQKVNKLVQSITGKKLKIV